MMIDWTKPLELEDGTPVTLRQDNGNTKVLYNPAGRRYVVWSSNGADNLDLDLANVRIRNVQLKGIDMHIRVGDKMCAATVLEPLLGSRHWVVEKVNEDGTLRLRAGSDVSDHISSTSVRFACHNLGAPFLTENILDEEKHRQDGYIGGLRAGLQNQFHNAGGPHVGSSDRLRDCRHWQEMVAIRQKNANAWLKGWAEGQAHAKTMTPPIDLDAPLRFHLSKEPVTLEYGYQIGRRYSYTQIAGTAYEILPNGLLKGYFDDVVENIPMQYRSGYMIVGQGHPSLEETHEGISAHWWKQKGLYAPGCYIVQVQQRRESGHDRWQTYKVDGPVEPLAEVVRRERRMEFDREGRHVYGPGPKRILDNPTNQFVDIVFEDGKIVEVKHG